MSLGWAFTSLFYSINAGILEVAYQDARENDPKTYWQKVKKFWRA
jgi:hypothetical protein